MSAETEHEGSVVVEKIKSVVREKVISELKNSTLLSYSQKATNDLAFSGDGKKKAQKRATGIKAATGKLAIRATDPDGKLGINKNPKNEEVILDYLKERDLPESIVEKLSEEQIAYILDVYIEQSENINGSVGEVQGESV